MVLLMFYILLFAIAVTLDSWADGLIRAFRPLRRIVL